MIDLSPSQVAQIEALRDAYERWAGGVLDRQAAAVVTAYGNNGAQADCIAEKGLSWSWQEAIGPVRVGAFYQQNVFVAPPERALTFAPQVNALAASLEPRRHQTPPEPLASALDECSFTSAGSGKIIGQMSEEELQALTYPGVVDDLEFEWSAMLDEATAALGDPREVFRCFEATTFEDGPLRGIEGKNTGQNWLTKVRNTLPLPQHVPSLGKSSSDPAWSKAQAGESQLVDALWACREGSSAQALGSVELALPQFKRTFAEDLAEAERSWAHVQELARKLGWTPGDPLAGAN